MRNSRPNHYKKAALSNTTSYRSINNWHQLLAVPIIITIQVISVDDNRVVEWVSASVVKTTKHLTACLGFTWLELWKW